MIDINVSELKARIAAGEKLNIVDVREVHEFEEYNIDGKLIPLGELPSRLEELEALKEEEIIVHCRSGMRSASAKQYLLTNGFTKVRNLQGGILEWQRNFG